MPRKARNPHGHGIWSEVGSRPAAPPKDELPSFDSVRGLGAVLDSLMEAGVYLGIQRGNDGAVIILTLLDGPRKVRATAHSFDELVAALTALAHDYGDEQTIALVSNQ